MERLCYLPAMPSFRCAGPLLALCLAACSPAAKAPRQVVHDLVALFPAAEARHEVGGIDFGSFEARAHLVSGWSRNERAEDGMSFVWSQGEVSVVEFFLSAPRDLQAAIRCAPLLPPDGLQQALRPELNGHALAEVVLAPGMRDYVIALPRTALVEGTNRLVFRYRFISEPSRDTGHRRLAVQWDALRFRAVRQPAAELPRSEKGALYLPYGSGLVYFLDLSADCRGSRPGAPRAAISKSWPRRREESPRRGTSRRARRRGPWSCRAGGPASSVWPCAPWLRSPTPKAVSGWRPRPCSRPGPVQAAKPRRSARAPARPGRT